MTYRVTWSATTIGGITVAIVAGCVAVVLVVLHPWTNSSHRQHVAEGQLGSLDTHTKSSKPDAPDTQPSGGGNHLGTGVGKTQATVSVVGSGSAAHSNTGKGGRGGAKGHGKPSPMAGASKGTTGVTVGHVGQVVRGGTIHGGSAKAVKPTESQIVGPYMAQLASLKSQYIGSMTALYDQARAQYHAGKGSKSAIEHEYYPQFASLENSAQDQVNSILFALRAKLLANGYTTMPVDTLRSEYQQEVAQAMAKFHG